MNGFKSEEIVRVQGKDHPVLGGRLRIAHEIFKEKLSIETELVEYEIDRFAVVRARVETPAGVYSATGTATAARDPKLADSLLELAESRACARALRLSGVGTETCGYEELGASEALGGGDPQRQERTSPQVASRVNGNGRQRPTPATSAQRRALMSIADRMGRDLDQVVAEVFPDHAPDDLSLTQASQLIDKLKMKNGNGHAGERR